MNIRRFTATAVMAIATVGIATGTAHGEAAGFTAPVVQGAGYEVAVQDAGRSITTTTAAGSFRLDGNVVSLTDAAGASIGKIPLVYQAAGQTVAFTPAIASDGRTLTMSTDAQPTARTIAGTCWDEVQRAAPGAAVGALIGFLVGVFLIAGWLITTPIGAAIGLAVMGGPALGEACLGGR